MLAFLFVDGLGLSADPRSPLRQLELPTLRALTGDFSPAARNAPGVAYRVLDANLGFEGLPQSATGQTTLLTGTNASALLGHHQGPHPGRRLQELLREQSLQVWAARQGLRLLHANGYRQEYLERLRASRRNLFSAFAFAAVAAGLELLPLGDPRTVPPAFWPDPERSGERFAAMAQGHDLVLLENWSLDYSAHREPERLSERFTELDRFVRGWLEAGPEATLLLTADHGNAEEPWHSSHTRNPVPLLVVGPKASTVPPMGSLVDVAPWVRGQF
ncbi:metalloenzyme [Calidithermus roseus]|uniref:2,3-bisphosphoglycerate-independent phosphoglycerate mutase n=1 Tax=Calidithermus roseus TaxID=1644118 RepID=A0A399EMI2_9DEIN|nr:metalloenzyme [Calidithermus roseus]RIH85168.1 2,3-bisphosphoglycerate-independent phosphoglycerate mutase [Calidithermus roseus]